MSSSTSSSEPGLPRALLVALAVVACVEWAVGASATRFMESQPLVYETKLAALDGALRGDVVFLGDSTSVAAVLPAAVQQAFPEDARAVNLALPGSGPVVAEYLLDRLLAGGREPPRLLVLAFSTLSFTEWRENFVEYPLTHLLPAGPVLRAAIAERDPGYLLEWLATRLPSVRHREELKSGALSLLFDRWPGLTDPWRALTGNDDHGMLFRWNYERRSLRNRRLAEDLLRQRGWRLFEEMRLPSGELGREVRFDRGPFRFPPFAPTPREERALARLLERCRERGIPVLVLPAAQPRALALALAREGGGERLDAFARRHFGAATGAPAPLGLALPWPHRYFADLAHVNEAGLARYTETILPALRDAAARLTAPPRADAPERFVYPRRPMSGAGPSVAAHRAEVEASLRRFFAERSGGALAPESVDPTRHLFDAGYVDSMNSLTLLDWIEERYGVVVPEVDLVGGLGTLASLAEYVARNATASR
jgi:acyl carrier protein